MISLTKDVNTVLLTTFKDNLYDEVDTTRYWKLYDGAVENTTQAVANNNATKSIEINSGYAVLTDGSNNQNFDIPCLYNGTPLTIEAYVYAVDTNGGNIISSTSTTSVRTNADLGVGLGITKLLQGSGGFSQSSWDVVTSQKYKLALNQWNYIAFCYQNGRHGIKINDNPIETSSAKFTSANNRPMITLGKNFYIGSGGGATIGKTLIGGVRISNISRYDLSPQTSPKYLKQY
jgi:hypothetical protein